MISGLSTVTVTGTFVNVVTGLPSSGSVRFALSGRWVNTTTDTIVTPGDFSAVLDANGHFAVVIPATDDPDFLPTDRYWTVTEFVDGSSRSYAVLIPASPSTQDLSDIAPIDPVDPSAVYQLIGGSDTRFSILGLPYNVTDLDTTGVNDVVPTLQAALDAGYRNLVLPNGTLLFDTLLHMDDASHETIYTLKGSGETLISLGANGVHATTFDTYDASTRWLINLNTSRDAVSAGAFTPSDANKSTGGSYPTSPRLMLDTLTVTSGGANRGLVYGNTAAIQANGVTSDSCKYINSFRGYSDGTRLYNIQLTNAVSGGCFFVQPTNGDGVIIIGAKSFGQKIADLTTVHGGYISGIDGGEIKMNACRGMYIVMAHMEMGTVGSSPIGPGFSISNSHVIFDGLYNNAAFVAGQFLIQIVDNAANESQSDVIIRCPELGMFFDNTSVDPLRVVDLRLSAVNPSTRVRVLYPSFMVTPQGSVPQWRESMLVSSAVAGITTAIANARHMFARSWELVQINSVWTIQAPDAGLVVERAAATGTLFTDTSLVVHGTNTPATTNYYAVMFRDMIGNYSAASPEVSGVVPASGTLGIKVITPVPPTTAVLVRKKGSSGVLSAPTAYVEIPVDAFRTEWMDSGVNINGRPWITTSVPVPNTVAATNHTYDKVLWPNGTQLSLLHDGGVKTAAYAMLPNESVRVDTTGGAVPITLPLTPPNGTRQKIKNIAGTTPPTFATQGADVINIAGGSTTGSLTTPLQGVELTYWSGVWEAFSNLALSSLDSRYATLAGDGWPSDVEATMSRYLVVSGAVTMTSGTLRLAYFQAKSATARNNIRVYTGGTAAGATPTLIRYGIYSVAANGDLTLVASTANNTADLASINTAYTDALTSAWTPVIGSWYALGIIVVTGAAAPQLIGVSLATPMPAVLAESPRLAGALTGQTDLPATIANGTITNTSVEAYAEAT